MTRHHPLPCARPLLAECGELGCSKNTGHVLWNACAVSECGPDPAEPDDVDASVDAGLDASAYPDVGVGVWTFTNGLHWNSASGILTIDWLDGGRDAYLAWIDASVQAADASRPTLPSILSGDLSGATYDLRI